MSKRKYPVVTSSQKVTWIDHINDITRNASASWDTTNKTSHKHKDTILAITPNHPIFVYSSLVWEPNKLKDFEQLKVILKRAARFVNSDYNTNWSLSRMIKDVEWHELNQRRAHSKLMMMIHRIPLNVHLNSQISNTGGLPTDTLCHSARRTHTDARFFI